MAGHLLLWYWYLHSLSCSLQHYHFKGYLSSVWISIKQSVMVSGVVCVLYGLSYVIGHVQLSSLIVGGHWDSDNYGLLNYICVILLKSGWKVSTCVRMASVTSFLNQTTPFNSDYRKSKCSIYDYHQMSLIGFRMKILTASGTESDYAIRCTWVLSIHLRRWEQWMYNRSPERILLRGRGRSVTFHHTTPAFFGVV